MDNSRKELDRYISEEPFLIEGLIDYPLWKYDLDGVRLICEKILLADRIEALYLDDQWGKQVYGINKNRGVETTSHELPVFYENDRLGDLVILFSRRELIELRHNLLLIVLPITILTFFIAIIIMRFFFFLFFTKSFEKLYTVLDNMKSGKYIWQYSGKNYKEIQPFVDELKLMSLKLFENKNAVEKYTRELEGVNDSLLEEIKLRKDAQDELHHREERYKLALEFSNDGIWDWDIQPGEIYFSPVWKKLLGYDDDELPNEFSVWEKLTHKEDSARAWSMQEALVAGERDDFEVELRMKDKEGRWVYILSRAKIVLDEEGRAVRMVGTHQDITRRKQYENELKLKNAAIDYSLNGFDIVNEEKKLVYVNKAFARMFGYDNPEQMIGLDTSPLWKDSALPDTIIDELKRKGEFTFEQVARKRDGTLFDILMYARLAYDQEGRVIYPRTCIDITGRKKAEEERLKLEKELLQAHKMEAIGTLAGGIAHDFNNILSSILGYSDLTLDCLGGGGEQEANEYLGEVYKAALRARDLVKQILTFARKSDEVLKPIQPAPIVKEIVKFLRSSIPTNIEIVTIIDSQAHVIGNPTQIHQILLNLCTNAADAMAGEGGTLEVRLEDCQWKREDGKFSGLKEGKYVRIVVSDTGTGIPQDIRDSVFQPYFTTKEIGQGTGMGLALVHGIVEKYQGKVELQSEEGKGTVFTIYLPVTDDVSREEINLFVPLPTGNERILLVDDEPAIARLAEMNLSNLGYEVVAKTDSLEVLDLFRADPHGFDLLITDMSMPGLTGDKLAREAVKIRKDIPIILCTGYSKPFSEGEREDREISRYLSKPITKKDLAENVRLVLDGTKENQV